MRTVILVFCLALFSPATSRGASTAFDYRRNLGIAVQLPGRTCLEIGNPNLNEGQKVQFLNTDTPPTTGQAEIVRKLEQACISGNGQPAGLSHYELKVDEGALTKSAPAFAIVGSAAGLTVRDSQATADLDGNGHPETFRSCTSAEGVHLTVWKGPPLRGIRKWHFYYYLGYDVEPNCTRRDTRPGSR